MLRKPNQRSHLVFHHQQQPSMVHDVKLRLKSTLNTNNAKKRKKNFKDHRAAIANIIIRDFRIFFLKKKFLYLINKFQNILQKNSLYKFCF
jgi:hypothetical protein